MALVVTGVNLFAYFVDVGVIKVQTFFLIL